MLDNEDRANIGEELLKTVNHETNVLSPDGGNVDIDTAVTDSIAYLLHVLVRVGDIRRGPDMSNDVKEILDSALRSFEGDAEDGDYPEYENDEAVRARVCGLDG